MKKLKLFWPLALAQIIISFWVPVYAEESQNQIFPKFIFSVADQRQYEQNYEFYSTTRWKKGITEKRHTKCILIYTERVDSESHMGGAGIVNIISSCSIWVNGKPVPYRNHGSPLGFTCLPNGQKKLGEEDQPFTFSELRFPSKGLSIGNTWSCTQPALNSILGSMTVNFKLESVVPYGNDKLLNISSNLIKLEDNKDRIIEVTQAGNFFFLLKRGCILQTHLRANQMYQNHDPEAEIQVSSGTIDMWWILK